MCRKLAVQCADNNLYDAQGTGSYLNNVQGISCVLCTGNKLYNVQNTRLQGTRNKLYNVQEMVCTVYMFRKIYILL